MGNDTMNTSASLEDKTTANLMPLNRDPVALDHEKDVPRDIPLEIDYKLLTINDKNHLPPSISPQELQSRTRNALQSFMNRIFKFPQIKTAFEGTDMQDRGVYVSLDPDAAFSESLSHDPAVQRVQIQLPRMKPVPKQKPMTRWEKFAKEKGIQKRKKSRYEYNLEKDEFKLRHVQDKMDDWLIEVPKNVDPSTDMYAAKKEQKKANAAKNKMQQRRNQEEAATSSGAKIAAPAIPSSGVTRPTFSSKRPQLAKQVKQVKLSTASMGKFDKTLENESMLKMKGSKRKFQSTTIPAAKEKEQHLRLAQLVGDGTSSVSKAQIRKKTGR